METLETISKRRSTRAYEDKQISNEDLDKIIEASKVAPIAGGIYSNMHLTVVKNKDMVKELSEFTKESTGMKINPYYGATIFILISGKEDFQLEALFTNVGCILENISLAVTDLGYGSVINWTTGFALLKNKELCDKIDIPGGFRPLAGIALGIPNKEKIVNVDRKKSFEVNII